MFGLDVCCPQRRFSSQSSVCKCEIINWMFGWRWMVMKVMDTGGLACLVAKQFLWKKTPQADFGLVISDFKCS